ncbi:MAG: thioester domain-containing protein [Propionibacteriaceae bacterium]|nr:thioester domain-containing protein [Propionibacteriaceae bacterium]
MKAIATRRASRGIMAFLAALLTVALSVGGATTARADDFPPGYPKLGTAGESVRGLRGALIGGQYSNTVGVLAQLFTVHTNENHDGDIQAYCIELEVNVKFETGLEVSPWDKFPGDNEFKSNPQARAKVAWIVQRSFPQTQLADVAKASGVEGLTQEEAITATQSAIWHFTNKVDLQGLIAQGNQVDKDSDSAKRVLALYNYLTGEKNVGLEETEGPTVDVKATDETGTAGQLVGPITINSTQGAVEITSDLAYDLVDADGNKVDPKAAPTGVELFLNVPANAPAGEQKIEVKVEGAYYAGKLLISTGPRSQTIIIGDSNTVTKEANGAVRWDAAPAAAPTPSPSPEPSPSPSASTPAPSATPSAPTPSVTAKPTPPAKKPGPPKTGI